MLPTFAQRLNTCLSPDGDFHHEGHVKLAYIYLSQYTLLEAITLYCKGLKQFAESHGFASKYHQTLTVLLLLQIYERMGQSKATSWEDFAQQNPDLLGWNKAGLEALYSSQTLWSETARLQFVLPDKIAEATG